MDATMNRVIDLKHKPAVKETIMMKRDSAAESEDDEVLGGGAPEDERRKRVAMKKGGDGDAGSTKSCQAENCSADLTEAKTYHRRHKVCEPHAKAQVVVVAGIRQRFCQQCSRFHEVSEFDEAKRSCRRRLAGHNERRRKNPSEAEGSRSSRTKGKDMVDDTDSHRGRIQQSSTYKHFHLR